MKRPSKIKSPSYLGYLPSSPEASENKRRVRAKGTRAEMVLRRAAWRRGLRYGLHSRDLPGKPDLVFRGKRVAVFVDGDFWHGRDWPSRKKKLEGGANPSYWVRKIETNIQRDRHQTDQLEREGWTVLRFWESEIVADPETVVSKIVAALG
jgi:DNA mismatch endonuclease (patch repair protein)